MATAALTNLSNPLTTEEKEEIDVTWKIISSDLKGNGIKLFIKNHPDSQQFFPDFAQVPFAKLVENSKFATHAYIVMAAIHGMVSNLKDEQFVGQLMEKAGKNHKKHGLQPGLILNVKDPLLEFMKEELQVKWTPTADIAWTKFFTMMTSKMDEQIEGHVNAGKKLN